MLARGIDGIKRGLYRAPVLQGALEAPFCQVFLDVGLRDQAQAVARAQRVANGQALGNRVPGVDRDPLGASVLVELPDVSMVREAEPDALV